MGQNRSKGKRKRTSYALPKTYLSLLFFWFLLCCIYSLRSLSSLASFLTEEEGGSFAILLPSLLFKPPPSSLLSFAFRKKTHIKKNNKKTDTQTPQIVIHGSNLSPLHRLTRIPAVQIDVIFEAKQLEARSRRWTRFGGFEGNLLPFMRIQIEQPKF